MDNNTTSSSSNNATNGNKLPPPPSFDDFDIQYSHVDIIVDDINTFIEYWCPKMNWIASPIQIWGSPQDETYSNYAFIFDNNCPNNNNQLMFMIVQGYHGYHYNLLQKLGNGTIYRLCFKTNLLQHCFLHLTNNGIKVTNLDGKPYQSWQDVENAEKPILWLQPHDNLSIEILMTSRIDSYCEILKTQLGINKKVKRETKKKSSSSSWIVSSIQQLPSISLAGTATTIVALSVGFILGRWSSKRYK